MVCDERTRHSFLTKRCNKQDLQENEVSVVIVGGARDISLPQRPTDFPVPLGPRRIILAR